jgi:hypothetical protein
MKVTIGGGDDGSERSGKEEHDQRDEWPCNWLEAPSCLIARPSDPSYELTATYGSDDGGSIHSGLGRVWQDERTWRPEWHCRCSRVKIESGLPIAAFGVLNQCLRRGDDNGGPQGRRAAGTDREAVRHGDFVGTCLTIAWPMIRRIIYPPFCRFP